MTPTHPTNPDRKPPKCSKFKNHFNGGGENCIYCGACRSCGKIGHKYQKCPRFESPKPAQLAEEKGCSNCGACEAGSHLSPCDQEIEEPFPQSPLTQEDRELLTHAQINEVIIKACGLEAYSIIRSLDTLLDVERINFAKTMAAYAIQKEKDIREAVREDRRKNIDTAFDVAHGTLDYTHEVELKQKVAEAVRLERERCLKIVSRIQCPCESKCSHFNYVRDSAREQILNPESPESNK